jgi:hypothetical protein
VDLNVPEIPIVRADLFVNRHGKDVLKNQILAILHLVVQDHDVWRIIMGMPFSGFMKYFKIPLMAWKFKAISFCMIAYYMKLCF